MPQLKFFWKIFQKIRLIVENNCRGKKLVENILTPKSKKNPGKFLGYL